MGDLEKQLSLSETDTIVEVDHLSDITKRSSEVCLSLLKQPFKQRAQYLREKRYGVDDLENSKKDEQVLAAQNSSRNRVGELQSEVDALRLVLGEREV